MIGGDILSIKKKVEIKIFDHDYVLLTDEDENQLIQLAKQVNDQLVQISVNNPRYSQLMVAILGALRIADLLDKAESKERDNRDKLENLHTDMKKPFEELNELRQELEAIREQYTRTQSEFTRTQIDLGKVSREWARTQEEYRDTKTELEITKETIVELQKKLFDNQIELLKLKKERKSEQINDKVNEKTNL